MSIDIRDLEDFSTLRASPARWYATELLEGDLMTVFMDDQEAVRVCSPAGEIAEGDNSYWHALRNSNLADHLVPYKKIHAVVRDGQPYVFDYIHTLKPIPRMVWPQFRASIPLYDLVLPETAELAVEQVKRLLSIYYVTKGITRATKGVVWWGEDFDPNPRSFTILNENALIK